MCFEWDGIAYKNKEYPKIRSVLSVQKAKYTKVPSIGDFVESQETDRFNRLKEQKIVQEN